MIAGDHLQFLFQLWMLADTIEGKTPLFYHVYEFNQGNDDARRIVGSYYFPFGLFYAAGQAIGGRAVGWNLMLFVGAWLTYLMTWLLTRRYSRSMLTAAVAALPGLLLPYMWASSLGGSPTGLGMMWVPVVFLASIKRFVTSADGAVSWRGWLSLFRPGPTCTCFFLRSSRTDLAAVFAVESDGGRVVEFSRTALARAGGSLGATVCADGRILFPDGACQAIDRGTAQAGGRSVGESLLFAPLWEGWFAWNPASPYNMIYLGWVVVAMLFAGLLVLIFDALRKRGTSVKQLALFGLLLAAAWVSPCWRWDPISRAIRHT